MYGKIFDSMYEGTLYGHWEAIVTLQQMLVLCSSDGAIDMTPQAIAARTSIPLEIITKGIGILSEPDPYSRTPGEEGRRIALIDAHRPWGWYIVNHAKYRNLQDLDTVREQTRERVRRHREMKRKVTDGNDQKRHTDTDTNTEKKSIKEKATPLPSDFKISENVKTWALQKGYQSLEAYLEFFRGRMSANGKTYVDWDQAFMNCVREDWPKLRGNEKPAGKIKCKTCGSENWISMSGGKCERCREV